MELSKEEMGYQIQAELEDKKGNWVVQCYDVSFDVPKRTYRIEALWRGIVFTWEGSKLKKVKYNNLKPG